MAKKDRKTGGFLIPSKICSCRASFAATNKNCLPRRKMCSGQAMISKYVRKIVRNLCPGARYLFLRRFK